MIVVLALALAMAGGGLLVARQTAPRPVTVTKSRHRQARSIKRFNRRLYVHVAGEVVSPGLYQAPSGSRVADVIRLAGGARPEGNIDGLNLAAIVADGQKVLVPKKSDKIETLGQTGNNDLSHAGRININAASPELLEELDGVGPVLAKRIIDWREKHHGFKNIGELNQVEGIGTKKYLDLKDKVGVE